MKTRALHHELYTEARERVYAGKAQNREHLYSSVERLVHQYLGNDTQYYYCRDIVNHLVATVTWRKYSAQWEAYVADIRSVNLNDYRK